MIKETIGAAVLGAALFGAPAVANAGEVSTVGSGSATVTAHCDDWCDGGWGHRHHRRHGWGHGWGHHGWGGGWGHHGWGGGSFNNNYSGNQYGGINFRI
ncbi:hypothetical protein [Actinocorallia aurantiaca]